MMHEREDFEAPRLALEAVAKSGKGEPVDDGGIAVAKAGERPCASASRFIVGIGKAAG